MSEKKTTGCWTMDRMVECDAGMRIGPHPMKVNVRPTDHEYIYRNDGVHTWIPYQHRQYPTHFKWSIFTMHWPIVFACALYGRE